MTYRKKLIEVALPLEAINRESAREKSIRHGHPSTLHLWWARRPLAACRAVLFASLVDDPSSRPEEFPTEAEQEVERKRLFRIIEDLVKWENISDERVLGAARAEIVRSSDGKPPPVLDPFCGGGSIPLEAQRLGLEAHASDLNPVAVLITKALIEIPPEFAGQPPVHPDSSGKLKLRTWTGAQGLAEDVRYYGAYMRDEAERRIGMHYPKVDLPAEHGGGEATVIAWLWARTVTCPNPACGASMPLVRSFALSTRKGKEFSIEPKVDSATRTVDFEVRQGTTKSEGTVNRRGARCLVCNEAVPLAYIRTEGKAKRLRSTLMATVTSVSRARYFTAGTFTQRSVAEAVDAPDILDTELPDHALGLRVQAYGMTKHRDLFSARQLNALATFSDLVAQARDEALNDGASVEYADAIATYLALTVSKCADYWSSLCIWRSDPKNLGIGHVFAQQTIQMVWDFAEACPFSKSSGSWDNCLGWVVGVLERSDSTETGSVRQLDAAAILDEATRPVISTDPPYYDNVGYAALSDFFYVWLRRSLAGQYPLLFSTLLSPKSAELIAEPGRFSGDAHEAERFFEEGLGSAFRLMRAAQHPAYPLSLVYAFKQAETDNGTGSTASTGWETMLEGLLRADFSITATWPLRSELGNRTRSRGSNSLASSIVLSCRARSGAVLATRQEFQVALKKELPSALRNLQHGNIAPVDLAQASIGPGMAVFSRYAKVVEADGSSMSVRAALTLINFALDEILAEQEGEFDGSTRWAIAWFEQYSMNPGPFGTAETLSRAKNTAVNGLVEDGIIESKAGKVRLLDRDELAPDWSPATDTRLTIWEITQHLIRTLLDRDEEHAAALLRQVGGLGEAAKDLAYRLYSICERKKWAKEALAYNALVVAWPEIARLASAPAPSGGPAQQTFEG